MCPISNVNRDMKSNNNIVFNNIMFWFNINVEAFFSVKVVNKLKLAPPQGGLKMQVKRHLFNATKEGKYLETFQNIHNYNKNLCKTSKDYEMYTHSIQITSTKIEHGRSQKW